LMLNPLIHRVVICITVACMLQNMTGNPPIHRRLGASKNQVRLWSLSADILSYLGGNTLGFIKYQSI